MAEQILKCDMCDNTNLVSTHIKGDRMLHRNLEKMEASCPCGNKFEYVRHSKSSMRGGIL